MVITDSYVRGRDPHAPEAIEKIHGYRPRDRSITALVSLKTLCGLEIKY